MNGDHSSTIEARFGGNSEVMRTCAMLCLLLGAAALPRIAKACDGCGEVVHSTVDAQASSEPAPVRQLGMVVVTASAPSSLPSQIPTTLETVGGEEIARSINATDSEDALKYLPSLLVRKRYPGDYNHAVLSTRASGTGNSARSLVYADGIPISNLLGNGATFAPRWGLVAPEEIDRVDVLYGPFSAAYSGNSAGAVVDYRTRMPKAFEAQVEASSFVQPFDLYGHKETYGGNRISASLGDRSGDLAWWFHASRLDSDGQPLTFVTKPVSTAEPAPGATPVTGAVPGRDKSNQPWLLVGAGGQYDTQQTQAKLKLAYDLSPTLRASATLAWWDNHADSHSETWLSDAQGRPFYAAPANSGSTRPSPVVIAGRGYLLGANDFPQAADRQLHAMQGLSLKSHTREKFDFELTASRYDYAQDESRAPIVARPGADEGGAGRITDLSGTGWHTLAARGIWRPNAEHVVEAGLQQESYVWRQRQLNTQDWQSAPGDSVFTAFSGKTRLTSLYVQDGWQIDARTRGVFGLRGEHWQADDGSKTAADGQVVHYAKRREDFLSPKAAIGYEASEEWTLKASVGRAVRFPTVGELYQGGVSASGVYVPNDPVTNPDLRPERSWTGELSAIWSVDRHTLRTTAFLEDTRDALYSQTSVIEGRNVSSTQNVDHVRTRGIELAYLSESGLAQGLDLQGSLTYADSKILANDGFVVTPGDTVGKQQPRVPKLRASALVTYALLPNLSVSYGARYSGHQYGTLDNSDVNGFTYQAYSKFFTTDLRVQWKIDRNWTLSGGVDNLNNYQYWNFHPYPQRTFHAQVGYRL